MKKTICLYLAVLTFAVLLCGCQSTKAATPTPEPSAVENAPEKSKAPESLSEKLTTQIHDAYLKAQELPEYSTTGGMTELADRYAEQWKQVADEYYEKLLAHDGAQEGFHGHISDLKANWQQYYDAQCESYVKTLQAMHGPATAVRPIFAMYRYDLQKEWALQLVGLYQQLYTE